MQFPTDRRVLLLAGAFIALVAGLAAALVFLLRGPRPSAPTPAAGHGLVVQSGRDDDLKLDPKRPLRCFVGGQFVGELPLSACAQRNGVATGGLDVGLDPSGALAASNRTVSDITPLPPQAPPRSQPLIEAAPPNETNAAAQAPSRSNGADCWRYGDGGWRRLPQTLSLSACAEALFGGRCPPRDEAFYGRWGDQALRLADGAVEISADNQDFRSLVDPWPSCQTASR
jgi:hypothetical protein